MASVTHTKKGIKLADTVKLKGKSLTCEFSYEMTGQLGGDPKAHYFEKFRAYFGQEAAGTWNKASVKAQKKMQAKFDVADKEMGKFVQNVDKYRVKDPKKTIAEQEAKYQNRLSTEMRALIQKDIGKSFMENAQSVAEKRIKKEGTKLKKTKCDVAVEILKVVVKVGAVASAAVATAATGGAAAPLLIPAVAWVAFSTSTASRILAIAETLNKWWRESRKDAERMEKKIAELDQMFVKTLKFANYLEDKADLMEMEADKLKATMKDAGQALSQVNPKCKEVAGDAKKLKSQCPEQTGIMRDVKTMRVYAPALREAMTSFKLVKAEHCSATWTNNIKEGNKFVSVLNNLGNGLKTLTKQIENF